MNLQAFSMKRFLLISFLLNLPPILAISKIGILFLPLLFWVNIPVLWTGIAEAMGDTHFVIKEFGAMPQSVLAYTIIILFWLFVSGLLALITGKAKPE